MVPVAADRGDYVAVRDHEAAIEAAIDVGAKREAELVADLERISAEMGLPKGIIPSDGEFARMRASLTEYVKREAALRKQLADFARYVLVTCDPNDLAYMRADKELADAEKAVGK